MSNAVLKIATRKSALAIAQTTLVADTIVSANPDLAYELVSMTTEGDRRLDKSLASFGGKGVFIKELEVALLEGRADIAVHSLKDMPAEVLPEFKLAAVLRREDPRDAFIARGGVNGVKFMDLPAGARIGTGSIRRVVQLKALRPDLEYVPIRGNIQTRLSKLAELDGVVLAAAGLKRMGLADQVTEYFSTDQVLPASGQGILAIETLSASHPEHGSTSLCFANSQTILRSLSLPKGTKCEVEGSSPKQSLEALLARVNDAETYCIAVAEMAYLKALNAGCQFPVASFAEFSDVGILALRGIYWDESSKRLLRAQVFLPLDTNASDAVSLARAAGFALAEKIKEQL
ncbi:hydroxymethylbilane synthase [uncultured Fibrobacter sp.]|uniref:hydroxymethylbilane synthase n=1 Tax=uncultured Fibrobacter sp. TaxID=261512 RepID=UPI0026074C67|nr:hydroxymethylbilane synthase [uncultured Fibrobacter sp.]